MSHKESRRPGLVQAAIARKITNGDGARALRLSVRQFRRLKAAYRRKGVPGLLHGNRGRAAANRFSQEDRERVLKRIHGEGLGLNDCHLTEKLREWEQLDVSREWVRRLRRAEGISAVRRRRAPKHRSRRLCEAREGSMVLIDASDHAWFGSGRPNRSLLGAIDDATGKIVALHFRPREDLHGYTELLRRLATTYGLPCTLYGDRLGVFVRHDSHWTIEEELAGQQSPTQFGLMLIELATGYVAAHSPQAKGRIERLWGTLQDRLVQELRLRHLTTVEEAETYLPYFIADHNQRFARLARELSPAWRPAPRDLERILACRYTRRVARDNTVSVPGRWIQLPPAPGGRSWHPRRVELRELLDGRLRVYWQGRLVAEEHWPQAAFTLVPRKALQRRVALGLNLPGRDPSPQPQPQTPRDALGRLTNIRRPKKTHPWKRSPFQTTSNGRTDSRCT